MKKVLAIFDGTHFSEGSVKFASQLNENSPIVLTGIFLPSVDYSDAMIYYLGGMAGIYLPNTEHENDLMDKNIKKFEDYCVKNNISYRVHRDFDLHVLETIQKETRYADLLVLSSALFYENLGEDAQEEYLKTAMHKAECPIIVLPEEFAFPKSIIITYDGSESSVYAMKQFSYIFPQLSSLSTLITYVSVKNDIPDMSYLEELAALHFEDLTITKLSIDAKKYFTTWLSDKGNALLVTGGFNRPGISELFKKNFAWDVIKEQKLPLFIAHP